MYLKALKEEEGEEVAGVLELEAAVTTACLCVSISNNDDDDLTGCTYLHIYISIYIHLILSCLFISFSCKGFFNISFNCPSLLVQWHGFMTDVRLQLQNEHNRIRPISS